MAHSNNTNIALSDTGTVHRDNSAMQPICGSGAVARKAYKKTRRDLTCVKCVATVRDMEPRKAAVPEARQPDRDTEMSEPKGRVLADEEVTEVGLFAVQFEYKGQKIMVENVNGDTWQEAVRNANDKLLATASRTQYWVAVTEGGK